MALGNKYIHDLIALGENQHLDFKFEISDAKKIARTLSAFANTEGGTLLVGVRDNGAIAGIRTDEEVYMIESAAHIFCKPRVEFRYKNWQINGKNVLEVIVRESNTKPHLSPWKEDQWRAFVRIDDENFVANSVQTEVWKRQYNEGPILVKYNRIEQELLAYLKNNEEISLRDFCRLSKIKYPLAKKILVNLITIGVLKIHFTEKTVSYRLR
jgi:predicted HTH transcriptional regulator